MAIRRLTGTCGLEPAYSDIFIGVYSLRSCAPFVVLVLALSLGPPAVAAPVRKVTLDPRDQPVLEDAGCPGRTRRTRAGGRTRSPGTSGCAREKGDKGDKGDKGGSGLTGLRSVQTDGTVTCKSGETLVSAFVRTVGLPTAQNVRPALRSAFCLKKQTN